MSAVLPIHPEESEVIAFDYVEAMPLGSEEIDAAELEAHEWVNGRPGDDVTSALLVSPSGQIVETQVRYQFQNPEAGKIYRVKTKTTFDDGQVKVNRMFLECTAA